MKLLVMTLSIGCSGGGTSPGATGPAVPATRPSKPYEASAPEIGRTFADAQLAAVLSETEDDHARLADGFAPKSVVLWPRAQEIEHIDANLREHVLALDPSDTLVDAKLTRLDAGGTAAFVWLSYELTVSSVTSNDPDAKQQKRIFASALLTKASGWRAVASAFAQPGRGDRGTSKDLVESATEAGPLTAMLLEPSQAATHLSSDAVVVLEDARHAGAAAAPGLAAYAERHERFRLQSPPREIRGDSWGAVQAHLWIDDGGAKPRKASALVIGSADRNGAWTLHVVHLMPM